MSEPAPMDISRIHKIFKMSDSVAFSREKWLSGGTFSLT